MSQSMFEGVIVALRQERDFGFARCPDIPQDVYFRISKAERIMYDPEGRRIIGCIDASPDYMPEVGKSIVFLKEDVDGKPRATNWGLKVEYVRAVREMQQAA